MDPLWADFYSTALFDPDALDRLPADSVWKLRLDIASGSSVVEAIMRLARERGLVD